MNKTQNKTTAAGDTYWEVLLEGRSPGELPLDYPRAPVQSFTRDEVVARLSDGGHGNHRPSPRSSPQPSPHSLQQAFHRPVFSTIAGATALVLTKYAGGGAITLGVLVGTAQPDSGALLPLCCDMGNDITLGEIPAAVSASIDEAVSRCDARLEHLLADVASTDPARTPVFRILLVDQVSGNPDALSQKAINTRAAALRSCDLVIRVTPGGTGAPELICDYDVDLFEEATVRRFLDHLECAWQGLAAKGQVHDVAALSITSDAEITQIREVWNATTVDYPHPDCLHRLFEAQVARTPDAPALTCQGETLTYADLNIKANRLAHVLQDRGVRPNARVAVMMERSVAMVVALYGVMKAGGAYVPIDPAYPAERVNFMLHDTDAAVLLVQRNTPANLKTEAVEVLVLEGDGSAIGAEDNTNIESGTGLDDMAYVIYTSGSTGQPKGVVNNHRGICNRLLWMQQEYSLDAADTVLQKTPFTFDVSVWEFFWPLLFGARLAVAPPGAHRDSSALAGLVTQYDVTTMHFVPSMLQLFVDEPAAARCTSLKRVFCSGEALPLPLLDRFFRCLPDCELHNLYGPTEAAVDVSYWRCRPGGLNGVVPIGRPVANTQLHILDSLMRPLPVGVAGELFIGGVQVARGYLNRDELTATRFIADPFSKEPGARLYRTGDLARYLADGNIDFLGRQDHQVKMRGLRIELGEIEVQLANCSGVREAVVVLREDRPGDQRLVAYVVARSGQTLQAEALQQQLRKSMPDFMVPHPILLLEEMPLNTSGKVDRKALPAPAELAPRPSREAAGVSELEKQIAAIWCSILGVASVGRRENFFDLGGHSMLVAKVRAELKDKLGSDISMAEMFRYTTVEGLAQRLEGGGAAAGAEAPRRRDRAGQSGGAIAIVGLACRVPGAANADEFWRNLENGVESVSFFSDDELIEQGIDPSELKKPKYIKARGVLDDADLFDAEFFGYSPREAEVIDPQQRVFLEAAWHALEDAGYACPQPDTRVGVYAGAGMNTYLTHNLHRRAREAGAVGTFQVMIGNDKDFLPTRVSYKLNLKGPSLNVQTACSTSLVAVHTACRALIEGECEMALAGGVTVHVPQIVGYEYQEGMILSSDGHCRAFDARADGTIFGSGVSVVVLKRLEAALEDRDHIYAVIKGSAINNDGSRKIGYTAPSVEGQSSVIAAAQAEAGVSADSIGYVETHGTGTSLGDPVELEALTAAFRRQTPERGYCGIGSVKTNIGHTDAAAGATGLIKAVLSLQKRTLVPSLHYESPNPAIDFDNSPFFVVTKTRDWPVGKTPRRAGVSSFGIGGTNAHVILEEAPVTSTERIESERNNHLLTLSARSDQALRDLAGRYSRHLGSADSTQLANICYSANIGRAPFHHRLAVSAQTTHAMAQVLTRYSDSGSDPGAIRGAGDGELRPAFLMTGQGSQYVGMGQNLYHSSPVFRQAIDDCAAMLDEYLDASLLDVMFGGTERGGTPLLDDTRYTQPALFTLHYALARLWMSWGIEPAVLMGHSVGEYAAACIAGVFSLEDGLKLIAHRGSLMSALPREGSMLAVLAPETEVTARLAGHLKEISVAAVNGPGSCVISGQTSAVEKMRQEFVQAGIEVRPLNVSHAFHSPLMETILDEFRRIANEVHYAPPQRGLVSNVSGKLAGHEVASADYWCQHIRKAVQFHSGMRAAAAAGCNTFIECGPQPTLLGMGRGCVDHDALHWLPSLKKGGDDWQQIQNSAGHYWVLGGEIDWHGWDQPWPRRKLPLPGYAFQRQRYWVEDSPTPYPSLAPKGHPLLGQRLPLPMSSEVRYQTQFAPDSPAYVRDHRIFGVLVVAGASHCSLLLQAAAAVTNAPGCTIEELYFLQPFVLPEGGTTAAQLIVSGEEQGSRPLQLLSLKPGGDATDPQSWNLHVRAKLNSGDELASPSASAPGRLDIEAVRARCPVSMAHAPFYNDFWVQGADAGPSFRWLEKVWMGAGEAIACTTLPDIQDDPAEYRLYPGVIEACFQVLRACRNFESQTLLANGGYIYVPFSIARFRLYRQPSANRMWCYASIRAESNEHSVIGDLVLADENGEVLAEIAGFECRRLPQETLLRHLHANTTEWLYQLNWQGQELAGGDHGVAAGGDNWLILAHSGGIADALVHALQTAGHTPILALPGDDFSVDGNGDYYLRPSEPAHFRQLLERVHDRLGHAAGGSLRGVVYLWGAERADAMADPAESLSTMGAGALHLAQALISSKAAVSPALCMVTRGSQDAGDDGVSHPAGATLWGMARVLVQEHPELPVKCIDLSADTQATDAGDLLREIYAGRSEDMVAYRQGQRLVARLVRYRETSSNPRPPLPVRGDASYLLTGGTGGLGQRVARWLVEKGARHLVLTSRGGGGAELKSLLDTFTACSVRVEVISSDVGNASSLAQVLACIGKNMPPLKGIVHAAGALDDGILAQQS